MSAEEMSTRRFMTFKGCNPVLHRLYRERLAYLTFVKIDYALFIKANAEIITALLKVDGFLLANSLNGENLRVESHSLTLHLYCGKIVSINKEPIRLGIEVVEVTPELTLVWVESNRLGLTNAGFCDQTIEDFLIDLRLRSETIEKID